MATDDNVHIQIFDADQAPTIEAARNTEPEGEYRTHNTTRARYHEAVVGALNGVSPDLAVDVLTLGDSTTATGNIPDGDPLGNETLRVSTTDTFVSGQTFTASVFLDSTVGVGQTFEEVALVAEQSNNDLPINRVLLDDPAGLLSPKSGNETVTIDIELTQQDA